MQRAENRDWLMWRMCLRTSDSSGSAFSHTRADRGDPSVGGTAVPLASLLWSKYIHMVKRTVSTSLPAQTCPAHTVQLNMRAERPLLNILNQSLQIHCNDLVLLSVPFAGLLNHSLALCLHYNSPEITVMHIFKKLIVTWKHVAVLLLYSRLSVWPHCGFYGMYLRCHWLCVLLYCVFCRVGRGISSAWSTAASCWRHTPSACWWHAHTLLQVLCPSQH